MKSNDLIEVKFCDFLVKDDLPGGFNEGINGFQSDDRFREFLIDCTKRLDIVPEAIFIGSIAEPFLLFDVNNKRFVEELQLLYPNTAIELVCEVCVSAYAVILDFYRSNYRNVLAFFIENQGNFYKHVLSIFGLADIGFKAEEGVACIYLEKSKPNVISNDSLLVTGCSLIRKSNGTQGTTKFLVTIAEQIKRLCLNNSSRIISFGMQGQWSDQLEKGLNILLPYELQSDKWLETIEQKDKHVFSIKLVADLKKYSHGFGKTGLTILSIGFGGRFGIAKFNTITNIDENPFFDTEANCVEYDYKNSHGFYRYIAHEYLMTNDMKTITDSLKLGIDNSCNYYKWKIN